ncbi:transcription initiation factor TFIID subunit 4-like [Leopardus geoffroyi]|uniref:transcription initiation factor TFIID subunit 4-like n=1 Tax=Leopardus geoffroyi TaxID=46844 RepID=UPI001E262078|nr:transcription initiation factor TFIID subunit 4-like [Leopardus geoffroyi]
MKNVGKGLRSKARWKWLKVENLKKLQVSGEVKVKCKPKPRELTPCLALSALRLWIAARIKSSGLTALPRQPSGPAATTGAGAYEYSPQPQEIHPVQQVCPPSAPAGVAAASGFTWRRNPGGSGSTVRHRPGQKAKGGAPSARERSSPKPQPRSPGSSLSSPREIQALLPQRPSRSFPSAAPAPAPAWGELISTASPRVPGAGSSRAPPIGRGAGSALIGWRSRLRLSPAPDWAPRSSDWSVAARPPLATPGRSCHGLRQLPGDAYPGLESRLASPIQIDPVAFPGTPPIFSRILFLPPDSQIPANP